MRKDSVSRKLKNNMVYLLLEHSTKNPSSSKIQSSKNILYSDKSSHLHNTSPNKHDLHDKHQDENDFVFEH